MTALGMKGLEQLLRGADLDIAVVLSEMVECPEREGAACQYVKEGLAIGEKVLVILAQTTLEEMRNGLAKLGISLDEEMTKGTVSVIDWWALAMPDLPHAATKIVDSLSEKLRAMDGGTPKRVLICGLQNILSSMLAQQQRKFVDRLVGQIRVDSPKGLAILDPKDIPELTIKGFHAHFDGVVQLVKDNLAEGYLIGVVSFDGVDKTGIYLPVLKSGEEYVAGLAAKEGTGSEACPFCGYQILPGFDKCPRCKGELKMAKDAMPTEVDAVFDYLDKLKDEVKSEEPKAEEVGEDTDRRKKLEEFLHSVGAFEEGGEEETKEQLKKTMEPKPGGKKPVKKGQKGKDGGTQA